MNRRFEIQSPVLFVSVFFSQVIGQCTAQEIPPKEQSHKIEVVIPTAESEAEYIWRSILDTNFFEENNYQVSLPKGPLIDELKSAAKSGTLQDGDFDRLKKFVASSVYKRSDYLEGHKKISSEITLLENMVAEIGQLDLNWEFKFFDNYRVNLTLYGPGGSYNSDEGSLIIQTTPDGRFKGYGNPANTIIHEITHIGIEDSIIQKYGVPHALKERIVDTFVYLNFSEQLPNYRIQNMGDTRTDSYLKKKSDLRDLEKVVKQISEVANSENSSGR